MTPQEHNKMLGIAHLCYAGFHLLMTVVSLGFIGFMFANIYSRSEEMGGPPAPPFLGVIFLVAGIVNVATTIPPAVAGYALLKRRPWTKVAGIIAGAVAALSFPIGTALSVYTFWFLFSDVGGQLYGSGSRSLPPLPPKEWQRQHGDPANPGLPVSTMPPDWR